MHQEFIKTKSLGVIEMSDIKIHLDFHANVNGYKWYGTSDEFSEADRASFAKRILLPKDSDIHPIAGMFSCGKWIVFYRFFEVANFDVDMRTADYYVVGAVTKELVRKIDFKCIFEHELFSRPINRDEAMKLAFPASFDYKGGGVTDSTEYREPSEGRPVEWDDPRGLSSIGSWFASCDDNRVYYITNDMAKPRIEVRFVRNRDEDHNKNQILSADNRPLRSLSEHLRDSTGKDKCNYLESDSNDSQTGQEGCQGRQDVWRKSPSFVRVIVCVMVVLLVALVAKKLLDQTGQRRPCPHCNGTGWITEL